MIPDSMGNRLPITVARSCVGIMSSGGRGPVFARTAARVANKDSNLFGCYRAPSRRLDDRALEKKMSKIYKAAAAMSAPQRASEA